MSRYFQWLILMMITGSPLGSLVLLVVIWFIVDRFTLGLFPDPVRAVMRWRRRGQLNTVLANNPHDHRARMELAELLVDKGAPVKAVEVLKPTLERGDADLAAVFTMGAACAGAGYAEQGEKLLAHVREEQPGFRVGEVDLVLGRARLKRGDFAGAKEALERLVAARKGTVEGRVLLARAMVGLGDDANAALMRDEAWGEYRTAPRFQRRRERFWAWRARPSRPLTWLLVLTLAGILFGRFVAPPLTHWAAQLRGAHGGAYYDPTLGDPGDDGE